MKLFFGGKGSRRGGGSSGERVRQPRLMEGQDSYTFRRSRTITGSLSNEVKTTRSNSPDLKSERLKLHELHQHRRILKAAIACLVLTSCLAAYFLLNSVAFAEKQFDAPGEIPADDKTALQATINDYINRHPLEAFLATMNAERVEQFVQASHPEVAALRIEGRWLAGGGRMTLTFREPIIVWKIQNSGFYVDENGTAFTKFYGQDPPLKIEDTSGFTPNISDRASVASKRFIGYLGQLLGAVKAEKIGTVERVVIPSSTRQMDIYLKGRGYPIKTHTDRDPYGQAEDIKNALRFLDSHHTTPEYVDVRVEGKAFYR